MVESKEELKSFLMSVKKEGEKVGLKLNIQKIKILASGPITSWQIQGVKVEAMTYFIFLGSKITAVRDCSLPGSSVHGFSRQEYWSGFPFPSPRKLPNPGIEPGSPALHADSLSSELPGKPHIIYSVDSMWSVVNNQSSLAEQSGIPQGIGEATEIIGC